MQMNMECPMIVLNDLPDEILLIILKKLHKIEVLYSLIDVNQRFDALVTDQIFTQCVTLMTSINHSVCRLNNSILDQFCQRILPKIHQKVRWLNVESSSMERILRCTNYPNLYGLGLYDLDNEQAKELFTDPNGLIDIFKNQITSLAINITRYQGRDIVKDINKLILSHIFLKFEKLQYLNFGPPPGCSPWAFSALSFEQSSPNIFSRTLLELHVVVNSCNDCLYLLDGRFNQLHTFYVTVGCHDSHPYPRMIDEEKLLHLKCFSISHSHAIMPYDELVLPLIIRMTNLEKLILNIDVYRSQLIDGNHLEKELIHHLTKLKQFLFHIHSIVSLRHVVYMPSNEDIQYSFRNFKDHPVISYVDYFPERNRYHSHMYSYSLISTLTYYNDILNHFSGGLFKSVRQISLYDERPFEHCFFLRIAQSFPFLEELTLHNKKPQKNENQEWSTIEYSHLTKLDLVRVDESYVEQFLLNTKTTFLNDVEIYVAYESVRNITHQFTRDATRINCAKIKSLLLFQEPEYFQYPEEYFPHVEI